jgi:hypothetical protein
MVSSHAIDQDDDGQVPLASTSRQFRLAPPIIGDADERFEISGITAIAVNPASAVH